MNRVFIVNPNAGRGKAIRVWQQISEVLKSKQISYEVHFTSGPGEAIGIARSIGDQCEQVIALGGDGTLHEVVNGLYGKRAHLGIIPAGTGNDFARLFDWGKDAEKEVERILLDHTKPIDLVKMEDRVFINVAGMGFDAAVADDTNKSKVLKKMGAFGYVVSVFKQLPAFKPSYTRIEIDGKKHEFKDTLLIAIANAISYGGGMKITPNADYQDGLIDVCVVSGISKLELLRVFPQIFSGKHVTHPAVQIIQGKKVLVETKETFIIHADGEIVGNTPASFEILPNAIQLIQ